MAPKRTADDADLPTNAGPARRTRQASASVSHTPGLGPLSLPTPLSIPTPASTSSAANPVDAGSSSAAAAAAAAAAVQRAQETVLASSRETTRGRGRGRGRGKVRGGTAKASTRVNPESQASKNSAAFRKRNAAAAGSEDPMGVDDVQEQETGAEYQQEDEVGSQQGEQAKPKKGRKSADKRKRHELRQQFPDVLSESSESEEDDPAKKERKKRRKKDEPEPDHSAVIRGMYAAQEDQYIRRNARWERAGQRLVRRGVDINENDTYKKSKPNRPRAGQACDRCQCLRKACDRHPECCEACRVDGKQCWTTNKNTGITSYRGELMTLRGQVAQHAQERENWHRQTRQLQEQIARARQEMNNYQHQMVDLNRTIAGYGVASGYGIPDMETRVREMGINIPGYAGPTMPPNANNPRQFFDQTMNAGVPVGLPAQYQAGNGGYTNQPMNSQGMGPQMGGGMTGAPPQGMGMYGQGPYPGMPMQNDQYLSQPDVQRQGYNGYGQYMPPQGYNQFQNMGPHQAQRPIQPQQTVPAQVSGVNMPGTFPYGAEQRPPVNPPQMGTRPAPYQPATAGNNLQQTGATAYNAPGIGSTTNPTSARPRQPSAPARNIFDSYLEGDNQPLNGEVITGPSALHGPTSNQDLLLNTPFEPPQAFLDDNSDDGSESYTQSSTPVPGPSSSQVNASRQSSVASAASGQAYIDPRATVPESAPASVPTVDLTEEERGIEDDTLDIDKELEEMAGSASAPTPHPPVPSAPVNAAPAPAAPNTEDMAYLASVCERAQQELEEAGFDFAGVLDTVATGDQSQPAADYLDLSQVDQWIERQNQQQGQAEESTADEGQDAEAQHDDEAETNALFEDDGQDDGLLGSDDGSEVSPSEPQGVHQSQTGSVEPEASQGDRPAEEAAGAGNTLAPGWWESDPIFGELTGEQELNDLDGLFGGGEQ